MYSYLFPNKVWTVGIFHGIYYIYLPNNQFPQDLKLVITQSGYRELAIYMLQQLYVTQSATDMGQWPNYIMITFLLFIWVKAVSRLQNHIYLYVTTYNMIHVYFWWYRQYRGYTNYKYLYVLFLDIIPRLFLFSYKYLSNTFIVHWRLDPSSWRHNSVLVCAVIAGAPELWHQTISINTTDLNILVHNNFDSKYNKSY